METKVVLVTGSAQGIGKVAAQRFLSSGEWKVAICDVNEELLDKTTQEFNSKYGGENILSVVMNITDRKSVDEGTEKIVSKFGKIDCLINNAGITRDSMIYKMKENDWDDVIAVNLKGAYNCIQSVLPGMIERNNGSIINTSSIVGLYGNIGQSNYAVSKFGIIGLTKTCAKELGRKGIRVNAVAPGFTETEMVQTVPEKILDSIRGKTPLQRLAKPEEIADAYYFLASDQSSFITGHVLAVDGGLVL